MRSVKGCIEMHYGGDFGGELGGLYDSVVVQGCGGSVIRVIARGPQQDLERRR